MFLSRLGEPGLWIQGHKPSFSHYARDSLAVDDIPVLPQTGTNSPSSIARIVAIDLLDLLPQEPIQRAFPHSLIIVGRSGQSKQLTLASDAELGMRRLNEPFLLLN
jgi:hypothetical protein